MPSSIRRLALATSSCLAALALPAAAADHDDTPLLKTIPRHEARISDVHAFTRGEDLVIAVSTNPAIPPLAGYAFPEDLTLRIHVDNDSEVAFDDGDDVDTYGGTILDPAGVGEDILFTVTFGEDGSPRLHVAGLPGRVLRDVQLFAGLRDDPFIRGPRIGRNVGSVVIQLPLAAVLGDQPTLLIWATSKVPDVKGPISELGARALRSQFAENLELNTLRPRQHFTELGVVPDVVIFDTSLPAAYPNGRELTDDVVDLVGDPRVTTTDAPFPSENDVPFLDEFPYLAPPQ